MNKVILEDTYEETLEQIREGTVTSEGTRA